jgi:hypothetical protein
MCIKDNLDASDSAKGGPMPVFMGEYTILETHDYKGRAFYALVEFGDFYLYYSDHFATLPDSTADEMQEESREAIVNLETA